MLDSDAPRDGGCDFPFSPASNPICGDAKLSLGGGLRPGTSNVLRSTTGELAPLLSSSLIGVMILCTGIVPGESVAYVTGGGEDAGLDPVEGTSTAKPRFCIFCGVSFGEFLIALPSSYSSAFGFTAGESVYLFFFLISCTIESKDGRFFGSAAQQRSTTGSKSFVALVLGTGGRLFSSERTCLSGRQGRDNIATYQQHSDE